MENEKNISNNKEDFYFYNKKVNNDINNILNSSGLSEIENKETKPDEYIKENINTIENIPIINKSLQKNNENYNNISNNTKYVNNDKYLNNDTNKVSNKSNNNIYNNEKNLNMESDKTNKSETKTTKFINGFKKCMNKIDYFMRDHYRIVIIIAAIIIIITIIIIIRIKCFKKSNKYKTLNKNELPKSRNERKLLNQKYIVLEEQEKYNRLKKEL